MIDLPGNDGLTATNPAGVITLRLTAGGRDTLLVSQASDVFLVGDGYDFFFGDNCNDLPSWAHARRSSVTPGTATTPEGQEAPQSSLRLGASENIDVVANGGAALPRTSPT